MSIISAGTTQATGLNYTSDTAGNLVLQTNNGVTALTVDTSQRVGIGKQTPTAKVDVYNTSSQAAMVLKTVNATYYATDLWLNYSSDDQFLLSARDNGDVWVNNRTNGSLLLSTNNLTRINIDPSGRITKPYQPSFRAYHSGDVTISGNPIVYNTAIHNIGSYYNTSTGVFTAPVAGRYLFSVVAMIMNTTTTYTYIFQALQVNGGTVQEFMAHHVANYDTIGGTMILDLAANDAVRVLSGYSGTIGSGYYRGNGQQFNCFCGQLLG